MSAHSEMHVEPAYAQLLQTIGLTSAEQVFGDPRLRVWRDLEDRDNSTLDATLSDGRTIRLHVKRDKHKRREPMSLEAKGIKLLNEAGIASSPLVANGSLGERTFVITENLDGYFSADRLMETDAPRPPILHAMARTAAALHNAGLHHRDLYANHFYMQPNGSGSYEVRLIDTARVRKQPRWFRERWIVKDVAQLIFSVTPYVTSRVDIDAMLRPYFDSTNRSMDLWFQERVHKKVRWIERHDRALREKKPKRNLRLADGN